MAVVSTYFALGTGIQNSAGTTVDIVGKDFNPSYPSDFFSESGRYPISVYGTRPTDLTNYRYGHEIVVAAGSWYNNGASSVSGTASIKFLYPGGGGSWSYDYSTTIAAGATSQVFAYAGIDYDEFVDNGTGYVGQYWNDSLLGSSISTVYTNYDTNRNTTHTSGGLRIEGDNIHYIDGTSGTTGREHVISNDSSYSSYVGTDKTGAIWMADDGNNRRLYYVDSSGYKRRTYLADNMITSSGYPDARYVGTNYKGSIRVSDGGMSNGYGYLVFVADNGYMYRIMNGPV